MRFKGRDFKFDYDGFYVDMAKIDSIVIRSEAKDAEGQARPASTPTLPSPTRATSRRAACYINDPNNKSGRKKKGAVPVLRLQERGQRVLRQAGRAGRRLRLDDGVRHSALQARLAQRHRQVGRRASTARSAAAALLPDIKTKLTMQEDGSLGFVYDVPKDGFPLYKGRGRVFNKVKMDGRGLQADGTITYQSGTFTSEPVRVLPRLGGGGGQNRAPLRPGKPPTAWIFPK